MYFDRDLHSINLPVQDKRDLRLDDLIVIWGLHPYW